jgi:hypothetical protein
MVEVCFVCSNFVNHAVVDNNDNELFLCDDCYYNLSCTNCNGCVTPADLFESKFFSDESSIHCERCASINWDL